MGSKGRTHHHEATGMLFYPSFVRYYQHPVLVPVASVCRNGAPKPAMPGRLENSKPRWREIDIAARWP